MATPSSSSSFPAAAADSSEFNGAPKETSTSCLELQTQLGKRSNVDNSTAVNPSWDAKNKVWRDSSYDFSKDEIVADESPPSWVAETPPIGQISPREVRVSFNENVNEGEGVHGQQSTSAREEIVACSTTSASFRRKSELLSKKLKSRLLDPPPQLQRMTGCDVEEEDGDPFLDEDLPEDYNTKVNFFSPLTIVQLLSLILIIAALGCIFGIHVLRKMVVAGLELWKWVLMALLLMCGRMISGWGIRAAIFLMERNFLLRKRVLYFVYGLRNAVQNCMWLSLILIAWECIFNTRVEKAIEGRILPLVTRILICLLVGTLIWLAKTMLVKVLAMSFHVNAFFDRIQESLFNQYAIKTLSGPPLIRNLHEQEEEEENKSSRPPRKSPTSMFSRIITSKKEKVEGGRITLDHLRRLTQKNISAWNMKRLMNIVRKGILSTLDEQLHESRGRDESATQITSEKQAKAAAKKIFNNVAKPGAEYIYREDLLCFMRENEALKLMPLFEGGKDTKGISKGALNNWVVNAFRERRVLALSLKDTKTAVNKLHHMLNVLVAVLVVVIWLLILQVETVQFFILVCSQIVLVAFMFGDTAKRTFEAIVFLFIMHPYDVGDRVEIDGVEMVVEEMNLLTTVLLRQPDNKKIIYPNSVLSTKHICNYSRSPDMGEYVD